MKSYFKLSLIFLAIVARTPAQAGGDISLAWTIYPAYTDSGISLTSGITGDGLVTVNGGTVYTNKQKGVLRCFTWVDMTDRGCLR
jgi:hypothetical protein